MIPHAFSADHFNVNNGVPGFNDESICYAETGNGLYRLLAVLKQESVRDALHHKPVMSMTRLAIKPPFAGPATLLTWYEPASAIIHES